MADIIELVIKIPEDEYQNILLTGRASFCAVNAIEAGTPLPKGHGRLIDADAICKDIISALGISNEDYLLEAEKAVYKRIKNALTIIEADKEGSEE